MLQDLLICDWIFKYICGTAYRFEIWRSGVQSVIKGCVRGYQSPLSGVSRFPSKDFYWNCTSRTALTLGKADVRLAPISQ